MKFIPKPIFFLKRKAIKIKLKSGQFWLQTPVTTTGVQL